MRKALLKRDWFPTEGAATTLIFLILRNVEKSRHAVSDWLAARYRLAKLPAGRLRD
ncbi:hypothetical protein Rsw2DRAFT_2813 [Rhodobacter ferrooxidans]|uniref:Uncharacterized protein n=1 Tax=Rhodobacter ferrooxidans TaxID=371731 RepID=C8S435_9RHOB|nr:hypothetical protein Rsw2DRAFT_2813 [Rhodobacter sp. SW2]